jgi:hypothetical protein
MFWIQCWIGACNFLAFTLLIVSAFLLLGVIMDDRNK